MSDLPVIEFVEPMLGFPQLHDFALVELDEAGVLCALRSLEEPQVRFLVTAPHAFFPGYEPEIDDSTVSELDITQVEEVLLLVVVNAGRSLAESSANLVAPVVLNTRTRRARQVILDEPGLTIAAPLVPA